MKNAFVAYFDMDGVLNRFEDDKNARHNMWLPGYFLKIPVREGIVDVMQKINAEAYVVILTKVINRVGATKEKEQWILKNIPENAYSDVIYVPYDRSKADYIYSYYPSMIVDDKETNIEELEKKGSHGIFLSDLKVSQKYPNARKCEDIYDFYLELQKKLQ